ncbi:MAG: hypothetical protein ACI4I6_06950 [Hominimerdicola sp.]
MTINVDNPIIKYAQKGKPFQYDKLFYATVNKYILQYKNARLDKLTDKDVSICLARIIKKMEVNNVPVQTFYKEELDSWTGQSNYTRVIKMCDLIARDIFACFDPNMDDADGNFRRGDRLYCVNENGERDYIVCDAMEKIGLFKKAPIPQTEYFTELMEKNKRGQLPKHK